MVYAKTCQLGFVLYTQNLLNTILFYFILSISLNCSDSSEADDKQEARDKVMFE